MKLADFLLELDRIVGVPPGTLTGFEKLSDLDGWDSLAVMDFIALVDESFGLQITGREIAGCKLVADLAVKLRPHVLPAGQLGQGGTEGDRQN